MLWPVPLGFARSQDKRNLSLLFGFDDVLEQPTVINTNIQITNNFFMRKCDI